MKYFFIIFLLSTMNILIGANRIELPKPQLKSDVSLEQAMANRRSVRQYTDQPLSLQTIAQLLWSGQGITNERNYRTAPSAGATFPLELYILVGNSDDIEPGLYHYHPKEHKLSLITKGDLREELKATALGQPMIKNAPVTLIFAAVYERTTKRYGDRGIMYVHNEVGHASQNIYLQCESLGLGTVAIGAFEDDKARELMQFQDEQEVVYMMPVGYVK